MKKLLAFVFVAILICSFNLASAQEVNNKCLNFTKNIPYRSSGSDVKKIQIFLKEKGYLNNNPTGFFGTVTLRALKDFQIANGLGNSGKFGPYTRAFIKQQTCDSKEIVSENKDINLNQNEINNKVPESITSSPCNYSTAPFFKVLSPIGGENFIAGGKIKIKWQACNVDYIDAIGVYAPSQLDTGDPDFFDNHNSNARLITRWTPQEKNEIILNIPDYTYSGEYRIYMKTSPAAGGNLKQEVSAFSSAFKIINKSSCFQSYPSLEVKIDSNGPKETINSGNNVEIARYNLFPSANCNLSVTTLGFDLFTLPLVKKLYFYEANGGNLTLIGTGDPASSSASNGFKLFSAWNLGSGKNLVVKADINKPTKLGSTIWPELVVGSIYLDGDSSVGARGVIDTKSGISFPRFNIKLPEFFDYPRIKSRPLVIDSAVGACDGYLISTDTKLKAWASIKQGEKNLEIAKIILTTPCTNVKFSTLEVNVYKPINEKHFDAMSLYDEKGVKIADGVANSWGFNFYFPSTEFSFDKSKVLTIKADVNSVAFGKGTLAYGNFNFTDYYGSRMSGSQKPGDTATALDGSYNITN